MEQNNSGIQVRFTNRNDKAPAGKLASAEIQFATGALEGLKLVGFTVWQQDSGGRNVTFPARQYVVNGQRRSFALLRPVGDDGSHNRLRDLILSEFAAHQAASRPAPSEDEFPDLPRP